MEVLRDTVLDICRELFSNHSRPTVRVKCHIEVYTDVSQIFSTSFEDVLSTDLSSDEFEETIDLRRVADDGQDVSCIPGSFSPCTKSDEKCANSCRSVDVGRWLNSNSIEKEKCFEQKILDDKWVTQKVLLGDSNARDLKFLQCCSTASCSSISKNAPELLNQCAIEMDGRICKKRGSLHDCTSFQLISGGNNEEVLQLQRERDEIKKTSPLSSLSSARKASDCRENGDKFSNIHSDSSENLEIVAIDKYFPSEAGSSADQDEVDSYAADSIEKEPVRHMCASPLHCSKCLISLQRNGKRGILLPEKTTCKLESIGTTSISDERLQDSSGGDAWEINVVRDEMASSDDRAKKFACSQCDCSFSMLTNLRRHVKKLHHDNTRSPVKLNHLGLGKSRQLSAPSETKLFMPKSDLTNTKRSPRYRHVCNLCDAVFTFRTNLTRHAKKMHGHVPAQDLDVEIN